MRLGIYLTKTVLFESFGIKCVEFFNKGAKWEANKTYGMHQPLILDNGTCSNI